jgi:hypothetical protein
MVWIGMAQFTPITALPYPCASEWRPELEMIGSDSQFGAEIRGLVRCVSTNCQFVQVDENAGREKDLIYLILGMG